MDTGTAGSSQATSVDEAVALIKARMPETYRAIREKAGQIGNEAFALVRRGLRGEANCFYAFERGHVVGAPFRDMAVTADVAQLMVQFGATYLCMWPAPAVAAQGDDHGAD